MGTWGLLLEGLESAFTLQNMFYVLLGCMLGTAVGVLPGLGSSMAVALLLPMTFGLDPAAAFIMFTGVYFGGLFGDSTMAILLNTPGQASAIASTFEGHRMAKAGRAPQALAAAAIGAFIGGSVSCIALVFLMPTLADLSVVFGPAEYFALAVFAFVATSSVVSDSISKGLAALIVGVGISTIGFDPTSGTARSTFGVPELFNGVSLVTVTVAVLALGEVFKVVSRIRRDDSARIQNVKGRPWLSRAEFKEALPSWLRGTAIGLPFGLIPVGGADVPTFISYATEKALDKRRKRPQFGRGAIRGLAGPEAAGNATTGLAMGALLVLGLPVSATAAMMLVGFRQYGIQPGPLLLDRESSLVWGLLASFFLAMIVLLIINLPFAQVWAKLLLIPKPFLYGGIAMLCGLGVYAISASTFDLLLLLVLGLVAFGMRRYGVPLAPLIIGMVLGPLAEYRLREALISSGGDFGILVAGGIPKAIYALLLIAVVLSLIGRVRARKEAPVLAA